ncbi:Tat pathway signal protein [Elioraea rosea]|uniref:Tat pathway signal protein n=1 Tax=Elioraea rosea TaxID=2492390 RepID=UPI001185A635|nr:Tat pathway signal protein [Elioraea rosea]
MLRRFILGALVALAGLASAPAEAQQNPDFWIVNNSGRTITEVYVSSSAVNNWGQDRLGQNVLNSGMRFAIRPPRDGTCVFDIRVVYTDGTAEERRRLNTCNASEVVFTSQGSVARGAPQAPGPNPNFRLVNRSGRTIVEVYVSSSNDQNWGPDRLGQNVLGAGQSMIVTLPRDGNCVFDMRVVYDNSTATERRRVNTCTITEVTFP